MSSFTEPLSYASTDKWEGGRRVVQITRPFRYYVGEECSSLFIDVEEGFETDLGSIPDIFQGLIHPDSPWSSAYVVHDKLYREVMVSRAICDYILFEALGVPQRVHGIEGHLTMDKWQRIAVYRAVRLGGWRPYRRYKAQRELAAV